jgi:NADH:ubiquinone oxidoreductase subunit 2 (subunit N)
VNLSQLIQNLFSESANPGQTLWASLADFVPESVLCATIIAILLTRMIFPSCKSSAYYLMLLGTVIALGFALPWDWITEAASPAKPIFSGLLVYDSLSIYMRSLLLIFVLLFTTFTQVSRVPRDDDATEFYVLVLGAAVGMSLMI